KDNDSAGTKHRDQVVEALLPVVASLKQVDLPGVADGEDVTDWALRGGSRELLLQTEGLSFLTFLPSWGSSGKPAPFPLDVFPKPVADYVRETAQSLDCAPDLVAVPLLGFTGAALGRHAVLRIKRGFEVRATTWHAVIAVPGAL